MGSRTRPFNIADYLTTPEMTDAYIAELRIEIERLRDLLAWNGIDPDAIVDSARGADRKRRNED